MNKEIETHNIKNSSLLIRADYDSLMGNLKLYFRSGEVYDFVGVPHSVFVELKEAESTGKYFHSKIKPIYEHLKMTKKISKKTNDCKSLKKIILDKSSKEPWFKGIAVNTKEEVVTIYITDISHMETVKQLVPKEYSHIELSFKVQPNIISARNI